jgi:hypothetical protein
LIVQPKYFRQFSAIGFEIEKAWGDCRNPVDCFDFWSVVCSENVRCRWWAVIFNWFWAETATTLGPMEESSDASSKQIVDQIKRILWPAWSHGVGSAEFWENVAVQIWLRLISWRRYLDFVFFPLLYWCRRDFSVGWGDEKLE